MTVLPALPDSPLPAGFHWRMGEFSRHAPAIMAIFNDAIATSTALYEYEPRTLRTMQTWFNGKTLGRYPILVIEDSEGGVAGFGSYGPFRAFAAYAPTIEHSLYLAQEARGQGLGKILLQALMSAAQSQGYHTSIAGIDSENAVSRRLHERAGFDHAGTLKAVGWKFNRRLDLVFYQKILEHV